VAEVRYPIGSQSLPDESGLGTGLGPPKSEALECAKDLECFKHIFVLLPKSECPPATATGTNAAVRVGLEHRFEHRRSRRMRKLSY
jgi:hypothetical protein